MSYKILANRLIAIVLSVFLALPSMAMAATVVTVTPATGGTGISGSTAGGSYTSLTGPVVSENGNGDIGTGTIILSVPAGFEFNTGNPVTVSVSRLDAGSRALLTLASSTATVSTSTITITVTAKDDTGGSTKALSRLTWSGIQVRPIADVTTSGNITKSGTASISGVTDGTTNFGTLSETLSITTPTLTIVGAGAWNGTITSNDTFINCTSASSTTSGTCSHTYATNNPSVVLTATPDISSIFSGWSGGGCSGTGTCSPTGLTGTSTVNVTATFDEAATSGTVSVSLSPTTASSGTSTDFQVVFTNNTNKTINSACVVLPATFGAPTSTSITGIADWVTTVSSQEIQAGYPGAGTGLIPGASFTILFTSIPNSTGALTFTASKNSSHANCQAGLPISGSGNVIVTNNAPIITLNGSATMTLTVGDTFTDPGATATDIEDGDLTGSIVVSGDTVDTSTSSVYIIRYDVTDSGGLSATQVTRTVTVNPLTPGNTPPTVTLNGAASVSLNVGDTFVDLGAVGDDAEDGSLTPVVTGTVDTSTVGVYTLTYTVTDSAMAMASVSRTVTVSVAPPVNTAPTVTLNGSNPMNLYVGDTFTDPGATGNDAEDGSLTPVVTGSVDMATAGTYVITYTVTDSGALVATVDRTVNVSVRPVTPPSGGGGGGGGGGGVFIPSGGLSIPGVFGGGLVLGASTGPTEPAQSGACEEHFTGYLLDGYGPHDINTVMEVQKFLNQYLNAGLTVNGKYDAATVSAVKAFQVKEFDGVISPWKITKPTGHFYITTQRMANIRYCQLQGKTTPATPMPSLIPFKRGGTVTLNTTTR